MNKYTIKITALNGHDEITTLLTNSETGESREEQWAREDGCWVWQNGWGDADNGLYRVLFENASRTDAILTELEASSTGEMEIEA